MARNWRLESLEISSIPGPFEARPSDELNFRHPPLLLGICHGSCRIFGHVIVALFFHAGHGLAINGTNYLLPVDADLKSEN